MTFSLSIPIWMLWAAGIVGGLLLLALAALGVYFLWFLREMGRSWNRTWGWW